MLSRLTVFQRGLILVGVPFILELLLLSGLALLLYQSDQEQIKEAKYRKIAAVNARLLMIAPEAPYFLVTSIQYSSNELFGIYKTKQRQLRENQKILRRLLAETPELADGSDDLLKSLEGLIDLNDDMASARTARLPEMLGKLGTVIDTFEKGKTIATERLAKMLRAGEMRTEEIQKSQALIRYRQSVILWTGLAANLVAGLFLALFYRRGIVKRLRVIQDNTEKLAKQESLNEPLKGKDEIAQLDHSFHLMDEELQLSFRKQRELFENASDVICVLDYSNKFVKVNRAAERVLGYAPEELLSMKLENMIPAGEINAMLDAIAHGKLAGEPFVFENRLMKKDGSLLDVSWSSYWSQIDRVLYCVVHDISRRKRSERMKQKFLSMISSDLKRPLSAMSGAVAILLGSLSETLPKNALDKLQMAGKNLQRLLGLVNELLQVAEMESAGIDIKKEWCDTEEPLVRSAQEVEALAEKRGIKLIVESCQVQWYVDPNRIVQVIVNLLSNAIKFSPDAAVVTLSAVQSGDMIEVRVRDQGRGVPESHKTAIFEKFKQVEAADGKRKAGTGLGLPICKQIVEDHGGSIGVESVENQGSTFWFSIPRDETVSLKLKLQKRKTDDAGQDPAELSDRQVTLAGVEQSSPDLPEKRKNAGAFGRLKLSQKGAILVGLPLAFEMVLVLAMSFLLVQVDYQRKQELHYRNIAFQTSSLVNMYFMMALGAVGNDKERDWFIMRSSYETARKKLQGFKKLLGKDPQCMKYLKQAIEADAILGEWVQDAELLIASRADGPDKYKGVAAGKEKMMPTLIKLVHRLEKISDESEKREFTIPEKQKSLRMHQTQILVLSLFANVVGSIFLAAYFSGDIVSRLKVLADNAMRLASEKVLNPPLAGKDEIAELDKVFHQTAAALNEARKKERAVFDNSQDVICSISREGLFKAVNPACRAMWGYSKEELLSGTSFESLLSQESAGKAAGILELASGEHLQCELAFKKRTGELIHLSWSCSRAIESEEVLCVVHDITSVKELEQIKQEFLAMVSHDLRTPLTAVLGVTRLILAGAFGEVDERAQRILGTISKSGDQLLELINDLLDIEKLEAGKLELVLEEHKLGALCERILASCRDRSRVQVSMKKPLAGGMPVRADAERLAQAVSNVLNQSLARSDDESQVELTLCKVGNKLELRVDDDAEPLSESAQAALFDRFKLLESERDDREKSSTAGGLAMPIAKKIIESHGGSIETSASPLGNSCRIFIPID